MKIVSTKGEEERGVREQVVGNMMKDVSTKGEEKKKGEGGSSKYDKNWKYERSWIKR